jgi:hypothetical protein
MEDVREMRPYKPAGIAVGLRATPRYPLEPTQFVGMNMTPEDDLYDGEWEVIYEDDEDAEPVGAHPAVIESE